MNLLYYGDNLDVLRRHVADESVPVSRLSRRHTVAADLSDAPVVSTDDIAFGELVGGKASVKVSEIITRRGPG